MSNELITLLQGKEIGRVRKNARGGINFLYDDEWRKDPAAHPLSLSMPLGAKEHGRSVTEACLWGLLPDNEQILERWAKKFQVLHGMSFPFFPTSARTARARSSLCRQSG